MSKEIDVREVGEENEVKAIRFGDDDNHYSEYPPCKLVSERGFIGLKDYEDDSVTNLDCLSDEDVKNLIKALKEATRLGWFRD